MQIRRATPDDAQTVSQLATATFTETFGHLYSPQDLNDFLSANYTIEMQREALQDARKAMWLLEHEGVAIGHAFAGPCGLPHPDVVEGDGELNRLYVLRQFHNTGWGGRLFDEAERWLLRNGQRTLWIGVGSENFGAQRFYARRGFVKAGGYKFPVGETLDDEFILRRAADSA
jgi:ribosomal protein S18 acetylase RimI-like enzyme